MFRQIFECSIPSLSIEWYGMSAGICVLALRRKLH